ncbi:anti-sigma factor domain-containing protein [Streptomyces sp. NPDC059534]|uniref:anti-sigma factor n=1 Tax=Streptomyces sp. NPDC059534 TaxID=3346859 RepID=UPI0036BD7127
MTPADSPHAAVGAYVLHALPPAEEAAFENHLASCEACRREADELQRTAASLAAAETIAVPPELRRRTLDRIRTVRQEHTLRRPRPHGRVMNMALAASLAVAAALGGFALWQHSEADDARTRAIQAEARTHGDGAAFAAVLTAPDATLHTQKLPDGASAAVVVSHSQNRAAFTARDLPALTGNRVYELWYAAETGDLRPAGLLPASGQDSARLLAGPLGDATAVGITVEPAGGSTQPTSEPLGIISIGT